MQNVTLKDLQEDLNGLDYIIKYPILDTIATLSKRKEKVTEASDGQAGPRVGTEGRTDLKGKVTTTKHAEKGGKQVMMHKQPQEERLSSFDVTNVSSEKRQELRI